MKGGGKKKKLRSQKVQNNEVHFMVEMKVDEVLEVKFLKGNNRTHQNYTTSAADPIFIL